MAWVLLKEAGDQRFEFSTEEAGLNKFGMLSPEQVWAILFQQLIEVVLRVRDFKWCIPSLEYEQENAQGEQV